MEGNRLPIEEISGKAVFGKTAAGILFWIAAIGCLVANSADISSLKNRDVEIKEFFQSIEWIGTLCESIVTTIFIYGLKVSLQRNQVLVPSQGLMTGMFVINLLLIPVTTMLSAFGVYDDESVLGAFALLLSIPLYLTYLVLAMIAFRSLLYNKKYKSFAKSFWILMVSVVIAIIVNAAWPDSRTAVGITVILIVLTSINYYSHISEVLSK